MSLNCLFRMDRLYRILFFLYCLFLFGRDVFEALEEPIFVYLALLFVIPLLLMLLDFMRRPKMTMDLFLFVLATLYYILISAYNVNGIKLFMPMVYAGIAFRNLDFRYISKSLFVTQLACFVVRYWLVDSGLIYENEVDAIWKTEDGRPAHDFAYGNSNTAGMAIFFLVCMIYLCMFKVNRFITLVLIFIISLFAFYYTVSRTAFISSLLLIFVCFIPNKLNNLFYNKYALFAVPFIVISPLLFLNFFLSIPALDQLISSRLYYISYLFQLLNSPMYFITGIPIDGDNRFAIDNAFSYLLVNGGVMAIVIFFWFYMRFVSSVNRIPVYIIALILVVVISGIGESSWAYFGRFGSSFFWIILLNKTLDCGGDNIYYRSMNGNKSFLKLRRN